ncbi:MAG: GNAT family N-acetyltransferase, partial [Candidatus Hodarchaeales archaeon]
MINGQRITLRGLENSDVDEMLIFWNNIEFMNYYGRVNILSRKQLLDWIQASWNLRKQQQTYIFGIIVNEKKLLIGTCKIKILNTISRRADLSIGIFNPEYREKGYGEETMKLMVDYCFSALNLLSLELKVFENNTRAISCYEKVWFRPIGIRRKADFVNGEFINDFMMDLLKEEWSSMK